MNEKQRKVEVAGLGADIELTAGRIAKAAAAYEAPSPDDLTMLREDLDKLIRLTRPVLAKVIKPAQKRISAKWVGHTMNLAFHGTYDRTVNENTLLKLEGEGDDARATFRDTSGMEWEAYRYNGRWAYGSGAHRLTVVQDA